MNDMTDLKPRQRAFIFTLVDDHMYVRSVHMASVSTQTNGMSDIGDSIVEDRGSTKRRLLMEDVLKMTSPVNFTQVNIHLNTLIIFYNVFFMNIRLLH